MSGTYFARHEERRPCSGGYPRHGLQQTVCQKIVKQCFTFQRIEFFLLLDNNGCEMLS